MLQDEFEFDSYNTPHFCSKCNGVMVFKGVGEYQCEDCKNVEYDDFGKVRLFIESHRGATAAEIEAGTGVRQRSIRQMLREHRLEVAADSKSFLHCELCGTNIRSGRFCAKCETSYHRKLEEQNRKQHNLAGFGMGDRETASGAKRFTRENK